MNEKEVRKYVFGTLYKKPILKKHMSQSSILLIVKEDSIWDIMVFFLDDVFCEYFVKKVGKCFVIDDHDYDPWVFTRIKNYEWLRKDFSKRPSIALWIFGNALIIQDKDNRFSEILIEQRRRFYEAMPDFLTAKYIELRSERHNLRYALIKRRLLASKLIRATIVKLSLEICFLSERKPYPYKMLLPERSLVETVNGKDILQIGESFLKANKDESIIDLSEDLIQKIVSILRSTKMFSDFLLDNWWLHLI